MVGGTWMKQAQLKENSGTHPKTNLYGYYVLN
jgi:hypothetical protein